MPLSRLNPLSSRKTPLIPPPRSSTPRKPHRDPDWFPDCMAQRLWLCAPAGTVPVEATAWLRYSIPTSATPYSVTLDCAYAPDPASKAADMARSFNFMKSFPRMMASRLFAFPGMARQIPLCFFFNAREHATILLLQIYP
ncbi:hypothetical protein CBM2617_B180015 [Cupriavidus taiwanensis]|nr:hypothetical protein CBM2617_B180015 [Cupriavidus taiwanensis]